MGRRSRRRIRLRARPLERESALDSRSSWTRTVTAEADPGPAPVFVSYSRRDYYFAESLTHELGKRGVAAFLDVKDLAPGADWEERLLSTVPRGAEPGAARDAGERRLAERPRIEWERALAAEHADRGRTHPRGRAARPSFAPSRRSTFRGRFSPALRELVVRLGPAARPPGSRAPPPRAPVDRFARRRARAASRSSRSSSPTTASLTSPQPCATVAVLSAALRLVLPGVVPAASDVDDAAGAHVRVLRPVAMGVLVAGAALRARAGRLHRRHDRHRTRPALARAHRRSASRSPGSRPCCSSAPVTSSVGRRRAHAWDVLPPSPLTCLPTVRPRASAGPRSVADAPAAERLREASSPPPVRAQDDGATPVLLLTNRSPRSAWLDAQAELRDGDRRTFVGTGIRDAAVARVAVAAAVHRLSPLPVLPALRGCSCPRRSRLCRPPPEVRNAHLTP